MSYLVLPNICIQTQKQLATLNNFWALLKNVLIDLRAFNSMHVKTSLHARAICWGLSQSTLCPWLKRTKYFFCCCSCIRVNVVVLERRSFWCYSWVLVNEDLVFCKYLPHRRLWLFLKAKINSTSEIQTLPSSNQTGAKFLFNSLKIGIALQRKLTIQMFRILPSPSPYQPLPSRIC